MATYTVNEKLREFLKNNYAPSELDAMADSFTSVNPGEVFTVYHAPESEWVHNGSPLFMYETDVHRYMAWKKQKAYVVNKSRATKTTDGSIFIIGTGTNLIMKSIMSVSIAQELVDAINLTDEVAVRRFTNGDRSALVLDRVASMMKKVNAAMEN